MLRWLHQKLPKAAKLWIKLCSIACGMHLCLLFLLFFIYKGDSVDLSFSIQKNLDANALVVFMPFHKKIQQSSHTSGGKKTQAKSAASSAPKTPAQKPLLLAKAEKTPTSIIEEKKACPPKKSKPKAKPKTKKEPAKKDKKIEDKKIDAPHKKEEIKKEEPKKIEEAKKEEPKIEEKKQVEPIKNDVAQDIKTTDTHVPEHPDSPYGENIRYIDQAELDAMCLQDSLSHAIGQHWKPPVGVPKSKVCQLMLVIDWQGKIKDIKVEKSSGAAMYDVSARQAALAAEYPKGLWGKACTITFKQ